MCDKKKTIQEVFERGVLDWLKSNKIGDLDIMSDFFEECSNLIGDPDQKLDYDVSVRRIRYRLKKMIDKGLIESRRTGSGFLGKTDCGYSHSNDYTLPNFWL